MAACQARIAAPGGIGSAMALDVGVLFARYPNSEPYLMASASAGALFAVGYGPCQQGLKPP